MTALGIALKAAPWVLAGACALGLSWARLDAAHAVAKRDEAVTMAANLKAANDATVKALGELKANQEANTKLVRQLGEKVDQIDAQTERTSQRLRDTLTHDKASSDWGSRPVPVGVRSALRAKADNDRPH